MGGTYSSIKALPAVNRMGGTQQKIFLAPYDDFTTLQKPDSAATNVADRYKIATAHVLGTGKGFIEVYVTKDTGELTMETIGGPDRNSFLAKGKFYHPGEADEIVAFQNQAKNDRFILLVPLPGTNELIQVGSEQFQVQIKPSYATTTNGGDGRGTMFEYECYCPDLIKYTAATIPMKPAS
ncbi:hypothetical protein [Larkinella soli]|uniref:hypothetical protein n=1 Tax=Larkinella soli TaxID=1770527 RepID=UPI000FFC9498|nr:hypothetical protein [Larkinella soli]